MRYLKAISYFLFLITALSCTSLSVLKVDVLKPAVFSVKPEIRSVVLIDNCMPYRDSAMHKIHLPDGAYLADSIWVDDYSEILLKQLEQELMERAFFDTIYQDSVTLSPLESRTTVVPLNWDEVDSFCVKHQSEAVIAIEGYQYRTAMRFKNYEGISLAYLDVEGAFLYRMYDNLSKKVIDVKVQRDTIFFDSESISVNGAALLLPPLNEAVTELAKYQGRQFANHLAPRWESEERKYYSSGNYYFLKSAENIKLGNWPEAIKSWKFIIDKGRTIEKARAAYNLALASEILGDYKSALYWIGQSFEYYETVSSWYGNEKAKSFVYQLELEARQTEQKKLEKQVGTSF